MNKIKTIFPPALDSPTMASVVAGEINTALTANLPWLTNAFGISERKKLEIQSKDAMVPVIYTAGRSKEKYEKLFPDAHLGNFSFFVITGQDLTFSAISRKRPFFDFRLVMWFDFKSIYPSTHELKDVNNVVEEVANVLEGVRSNNFQLRLYKTITQKEFVYASFSHTFIESKDLMRPYGYFGITGTAQIFKNVC